MEGSFLSLSIILVQSEDFLRLGSYGDCRPLHGTRRDATKKRTCQVPFKGRKMYGTYNLILYLVFNLNISKVLFMKPRSVFLIKNFKSPASLYTATELQYIRLPRATTRGARCIMIHQLLLNSIIKSYAVNFFIFYLTQFLVNS